MVTTRRPVSTKPITDMEALVDHMIPMLKNYLSNEVTHVFFGDLPMYLPQLFVGPRKENRAIIAVSPAYDRLMPNTRVASQEHREIGIDIVGFVNITPYLKAQPEEAYGERDLSRLMKKVRTFLTQTENTNLGGRIQYLDVGDVQWAWRIQDEADKTALRAAGIEVTARIKVNRM